MLRYGLYTRKSHDDKKLTEKSTGEQLVECRALAQRDGLRIEWDCEESKSAKYPGQRAHYTQLIRLVERGKIDAILCWHVNRLVRNMEEGGKLVQLLIDGHIKEIRTPHSVYRSGENILAVVIEAASATQHSIDLVNTVKRAARGNFQAGGWNHKAPPGYRNVRDPLNSKRGQIELDSERSPLIRKAWDLFLTGEYSIAAVTEKLEAWGFRNRQSLNRPARPIKYMAVRALFRNPFYAGFVCEHGELVSGRHTAMVTVAEFQQAQRLIDQRSFRATRVHFHPYAGLMKCGYCGQFVTAEVKKLRTGPWEVYHCSDSYNKCTQQGLSMAKVEEQMLRSLDSVTICREALQEGIREIRQGLAQQRAELAARDEQRSRAKAGVESRLQRLTEMWVSGLLSDQARYKSLEATLLSEKEHLTLAVAEDSSSFERAEYNVAAAEFLLRCPKEHLSKAPAQVKRSVANCYGEFIFYGADKRIQFLPHPCLREIVTVLKKKSGSLEPPESSSRSQKQAVFRERLAFGGRNTSGIELTEPFFLALTSEDLTLPPGFELESAALGLQRAT
ncbi:MAG: recombinase family protein [Armatimonadetes bacterium]|nr:recombinase family protein [Armatimonadota bacterium]